MIQRRETPEREPLMAIRNIDFTLTPVLEQAAKDTGVFLRFGKPQDMGLSTPQEAVEVVITGDSVAKLAPFERRGAELYQIIKRVDALRGGVAERRARRQGRQGNGI